MPMNPGKGETEEEFISRCIKHELDNGTAVDEKQGYAMCKSMWDNNMSNQRHIKIKEWKNAK